MRRHINLRQIEAFKAVIDTGTVSRGAEVLHISQPAMSKLIAHLEADTGLRLFDRVKKRLVPTEHALRLHDEVERIFAGVRQVESAVDALHRETLSRIAVGVLPALSGAFIQRVASNFVEKHGDVFCAVHAMSSHWVAERVAARKLDVGLVNGQSSVPHVRLEPLMELPLVCILPPEHPLAARSCITPDDLDQSAFVAFEPDNSVGDMVSSTFRNHGIAPRIVVSATAALSVCEFVAAGFGVSLVHPLMISGFEARLAVKPFEPSVMYKFQLCRSSEGRNAKIAEAFAAEIRATAGSVSDAILNRR
ncbi:MAG: transcriptional regulator, LysR family [Sphingomonas bacterium]|uniref:LysR substrate-binding domain-containing protein n=1 Tax=Sphingomonas bacterium TaxID=1895847 RepID=UPI0026292D02|nr:LysR substrate-binding domain-containing protein [Sphingomonas bacterium]MDB5695033.1 transcriptional regulator, LysR family [Sphingomonas bacterium]